MTETTDATNATNSDSAGLVEVIQKLSAFQDIDKSVIQAFVDDAKEVVTGYDLPDSVLDKATRLYACHLLLVQAQIDAGYLSETMGPLSQTRADWSKNNDPYWLQLQDLLDRYGKNRSRGRVWTVD